MAMQAGTHQGKCRGTTLVVFGGIGIVIGISYSIYQVIIGGYIYAGVWGGLFIISTGCVAIAAGKNNRRRHIIALLVMSIISIIMAVYVEPNCLAIDAYSSWDHNDEEVAVVLSILGVLGFGCFLTTSIVSCVDLCSRNCCNKPCRTQAGSPQMVMISTDGKMVPVRIIDVSGTQQVVPADSGYTPLQWRNEQLSCPVQPSAPPPPYKLNPKPLPNQAHRAAACKSTTSEIYTEVLDSGVYLHAPSTEDNDGYEVVTDERHASGNNKAIHPQKTRAKNPPIPYK